MSSVHGVAGRRRICFPLIGGAGWMGGINYLNTLLDVISHELSDRYTATLLLAPENGGVVEQWFSNLENVQVVIDPRVSSAGRGARLLSALTWGRDTAFENLMQELNASLVFETARFYGYRTAVPALAWLPDFQHRHLPDLFPASSWWRREIGFRIQCATRRQILLSSRTAEEDCHRFYPISSGRTHVARFTATLDIPATLARADEVRSAYGLPKSYFFLPNQFWTHKNHSIVIESLKLLKASGEIENVSPVILSGSTKDPRNPDHYDRCIREVQVAGLDRWFTHIGTVPYQDVLALNAASRAVINPSLFEGWSTSLEEAKALGSPMVLSDIPIHREQAGDAQFFDPTEPRALAAMLLALSSQTRGGRRPVDDLLLAHSTRRAEFVAALGRAFDSATERR